MRSKGLIFTRHGTTDIGLKHINATKVNAFGDIIEIDLDGTAPFIVDNEHVVAWESTLQYNIKSASGIFGFKTGEGLVNEFVGKGKLYIQTRNTASLASLLRPFIATGK